MTASKPLLTLYSRDYCHLCHDMLSALQELRAEHAGCFDIQVIDVDADPILLSRYDERVPVLAVIGEDRVRELCHYFLDRSAVLGYLGECGRAAVA